MSATARADHLVTHREERAILLDPHGVLSKRLIETWPASAGIELLLRAEQCPSATGASVDAVFVIVGVFVRERPFGAFLPEHAILLGRKDFLPFGIGPLSGGGHGCGCGWRGFVIGRISGCREKCNREQWFDECHFGWSVGSDVGGRQTVFIPLIKLIIGLVNVGYRSNAWSLFKGPALKLFCGIMRLLRALTYERNNDYSQCHPHDEFLLVFATALPTSAAWRKWILISWWTNSICRFTASRFR